MKKSEECKIVRDLLPSCVDKVTDEVTNEFIQKHIEECEECKKILTKMGEEVILDKVKEKEKLDYLKKIKRKQTAKVVVVSFLLTVITSAAIVFCAFMSTGALVFNENRQPDYYRSFMLWIGINVDAENSTIIPSKVTNVVLTREEPYTYVENNTYVKVEGKTIKTTIIVTFDIEKDICIGSRYCIEGYSQEQMQEIYENVKDDEYGTNQITDARIEGDRYIYSMNNWTGHKKEEVIKDIEEHYSSYQVLVY
ncbi:MAG: zf-HC2 domain-containing protein [Clostridia bacterium]|jgi:hypothetical protein|nr:zf-HC2 domain-containing protein [Clostridia bacterium]